MSLPEVVSREDWLAARTELLRREKELTRLRDEVNADRRRLPMVRMTKPYAFHGPDGGASLLDLFDGRRQLVVHHFMFAPEWDEPCRSCSCAADRIGNTRQLRIRDTNLVAVSRAPYERLAAARERMGWTFPWFSSEGGDFSYDFHATDLRGTETPGVSAFLRDGDEVFHTYSTYGRGIEEFHSGYNYLDLTALGRQEAWEEPKGRTEPLGLQVGGPNLRLPDEYPT